VKKNVFIIYGGPGGEHEVSCKSAETIFNAINKRTNSVSKVFIDKKLKYFLNGEAISKENLFTKMKDGVAFSVVHGEFGEDGQLQKILEKNKIKFIGSGSKVSQLAIDKIKTQRKLSKNGIVSPKSKIITSRLNKVTFKFPLILKPNNEGSSLGLYKIISNEDLKDKLKMFFKTYKSGLLQEFVTGREFTCGVVEYGGEVVALPPSEVILTDTATFNYEAKYTKGRCLEVTPAKINNDLKIKIQTEAVKIFKEMGCKAFARIDMIYTKDGELYFLEINTIPGMTATSFIPQQLKAAKINLKDFIDKLI